MLGGTFQRIQFTPDLVPADLVGTRIYRPSTGTFDTELGPVFCNFLLADEINRAPAKVQSALLEVMQEQQVTIGGTTHTLARRSSSWRRRTRSSPRAPTRCPRRRSTASCSRCSSTIRAIEDEHTVAQRALADAVDVRTVIELPQLLRLQAAALKTVYVDPAVTRYAVRLASVTRDLAGHGLRSSSRSSPFGVSPRGPISMLHAARALAVLRGRRYVLPSDVHELAPDAHAPPARAHRTARSPRASRRDAIIEPVLERVPMPRVELVTRWRERGEPSLVARADSGAVPGPARPGRRRCARST